MSAILSGMFLVSCNTNTKKSEPVKTDGTEIKEIKNELVKSTVTDGKGNTMNLTFDDAKGTATVDLNGTKIYMDRDTTASGVRMHNDEYQYEEWQGRIILKKNGEVVFDSKNEVTASVANKAGKKLDLVFNNNNNTAVVMFNGQEIQLKADTTASGIRYSNADYVYEEWQGHSVLKKKGEVVFDNKK